MFPASWDPPGFFPPNFFPKLGGILPTGGGAALRRRVIRAVLERMERDQSILDRAGPRPAANANRVLSEVETEFDRIVGAEVARQQIRVNAAATYAALLAEV